MLFTNIVLGWDGGTAFAGSPHPSEGSSGSESEGQVVNQISEQAKASIIKFTENTNEFVKFEEIPIVLEIVDLKVGSNGFNGVVIEDSIPDKFELIHGVEGVQFKYNNSTNIIEIGSESDYVSSGTKWSYIVRARESGVYILNPALLKKGKRGVFEKLPHIPSNTLYITIINRSPQFINWSIPESHLWKNDKPLLVTANITDADNDTLCCLLSSSISGPIPYAKKSTTIISNNNSIIQNYVWDLTQCNQGNHFLTLDASDGKINTTKTAELEIWEKSWGFVPFPTHYRDAAAISLVALFFFNVVIYTVLKYIYNELTKTQLYEINPLSGRVGTIITIKGRSFGRGQGYSFITIDGRPTKQNISEWSNTKIKFEISDKYLGTNTWSTNQQIAIGLNIKNQDSNKLIFTVR